MEQLTYLKPGTVETREVTRPALRSPGEAIVRPIAVATCDLDAALVRGRTPWSGPFPLGHEGVAEVEEVGDAVTAVSPGDRVCLPYQVSCGHCRRCRSGLTAQCEGHGGSVAGSQFYGFGPTGSEWGGFLSDAVRVPFADHMLLRLPGDVEPEVVASLSDNIVDGWRTVAEPLAERPGATVLVVGGSGAIGLYAVASAMLSAPSESCTSIASRRVCARPRAWAPRSTPSSATGRGRSAPSRSPSTRTARPPDCCWRCAPRMPVESAPAPAGTSPRRSCLCSS